VLNNRIYSGRRPHNLEHSIIRDTVVFFDLFKKFKTLNFKVSMVI